MTIRIFVTGLTLATSLVVFSNTTLALGTPGTPDAECFALLDGSVLRESKRRWSRGDTQLEPAKRRLLNDAARALQRGPYTIVNKKVTPPSGDKHDYINYAGEWWPPATQNSDSGWVRRDGQRNPSAEIDAPVLVLLGKDVETLALAYYFTNDKRYANRAVKFLRIWFIRAATRMNPNATYGAIIPGRKPTGFPIGGITNSFIKIINAAQILEYKGALSQSDNFALKQWMHDFMVWMKSSPDGRKIARKQNNHGTHYDLLAGLIAVYIGDLDTAISRIESFKIRLDAQLVAGGSQPMEMDRVNNLGYHQYNLIAAIRLARLAEGIEGDGLSNYRNSNGVGLEDAVSYVAPYATLKKIWSKFPKKAIRQDPGRRLELFLLATRTYGNKWPDVIAKSVSAKPSAGTMLTYPPWAHDVLSSTVGNNGCLINQAL